MTLLQIYLTFAKYGLLCFGGGYMLVPLINNELVGPVGKPMTAQVFGTLLSIAQVTPGPIGINTATFVGFTDKGIIGAILATLGIVTPSLLLVIFTSSLLKKHAGSFLVEGFLRGMRPAAFGLIISAALIFSEMSIFGVPENHTVWSAIFDGSVKFYLTPAILGVMSFFLITKTKVPLSGIILIAAIVGALLC
jgi:chromate transporter